MFFLTTVLSISLVSLALSAIIIVAEMLLSNYGDCQIDINGGSRLLEVKGGASLLTVLAENDIFIPSACGGKATCGLCKVQVHSGAGPFLPTEGPYISQKEREDGVRLSCQVKVKQDLLISIPEELFNIREYRTKLDRIDDLTHDTKGLHLLLPAEETIKFKAGQYVQLYTKPYGKVKEEVFRAYSMASAPSEDQAVDLIVRQVPYGVCTTYVHQELKVGDEVRITGPFGDFYLRGESQDLIFVAGGSGLAPIRSLIVDILEKGLDHQLTFFFGAVARRDLYYLDFFQDLAQKYANFTFIPALSQPAPGDDWTGETGLITEVVSRHLAEGSDVEAYLCGSPGMVQACLDVLAEKKIPIDKIYYDKF